MCLAVQQGQLVVGNASEEDDALAEIVPIRQLPQPLTLRSGPGDQQPHVSTGRQMSERFDGDIQAHPRYEPTHRDDGEWRRVARALIRGGREAWMVDAGRN